jgi:hypothetical protein
MGEECDRMGNNASNYILVGERERNFENIGYK